MGHAAVRGERGGAAGGARAAVVGARDGSTRSRAEMECPTTAQGGKPTRPDQAPATGETTVSVRHREGAALRKRPQHYRPLAPVSQRGARPVQNVRQTRRAL